jgi:hypothetical protein
MRTRLHSWVTLTALVAGTATMSPVLAAGIDSLRVVAVESNSFEYLFTAVVTPSSTNPVLSFNHRSGRTVFARAGESVGRYTVRTFSPQTVSAFDPSLNATREIRSDSVTLEASDGRSFTLRLGTPLPQPGRMARMVDLESAGEWLVSEQDLLVLDGKTVRVETIGENSVSMRSSAGSVTIAMMSPEEKTKLETLIAERKQQEEEARKNRVAAAVEPSDAAREAPFLPSSSLRNLSVDLTTGPKMFFGTDIPYPIEYQVIPGNMNAQGQWLTPPIVVPRRFRWGSTGIGFGYSGSSHSSSSSSGIDLRLRYNSR